MKIDRIIVDVGTTLRKLLLAMENGLTAEDNLAPGGTAGQVLTSNGPDAPPTWQDK